MGMVTPEAQPQSPDLQTYLSRCLFIMGILVSAISCWRVERIMLEFPIRLNIAALWLVLVIAGATVWPAFKRGQVTKRIGDALLLIAGVHVAIGVHGGR